MYIKPETTGKLRLADKAAKEICEYEEHVYKYLDQHDNLSCHDTQALLAAKLT
jgi:hypothetical protein